MNESTGASPADELTEVLRQHPGWETAKRVVSDGIATGRSRTRIVAEVAVAFKDVLDEERLLGVVRSVLGPIPPESENAIRQYLAEQATTVFEAELRGEKLPLVPGMSGTVQVMWADIGDDLHAPFITVYAGPTSPASIVKEFGAMYERLYCPSAKEYPNGLRDAEWTSRHFFRGHTYGEIAASDDRSGYMEDNVAKGVQRFVKRWTRLYESASRTTPE